MPGKTPEQPVRQPLLGTINGPADLAALTVPQLEQVAAEIRTLIIDTVSRRGGHLASNLGVVELTLALHRVFDFAADRLLWDVGHQCYAHKIITGRREQFDSLRQSGGLSGFPDPSESPYDVFATGHAGTAISTATGLALAEPTAGKDARRIVAVVGDAAIGNGLSLEGMNNAGLLKRQFLVVLNDNSMAIDVTQGALARLLDRLRLTRTYSDLKNHTQQLLRNLPMGEEITEAIRHLKDGLRSTVHGEQVFEALGFRYFGPVDGHDFPALLDMLRRLKDIQVPALLHVHTQKGRGCDYAVEDPCRFHSPAAHVVNGGVVEFARSPRPSWTEVFGRTLLERARRDRRIVAITAAMPDGTGLAAIRDELPDQYIDVGICESHAVAMAAGLARAGRRPVVAVYSTFLQRAFDQVFQEVCLQDLPVVLCLDRAGLVGSDGAVHQGFADIAYLRPLPGLVLMAPSDTGELSAAMDLALSLNRPCAIRYPRDEAPLERTETAGAFELGRACRVRPGEDGAFLALGAMVEHALAAAEILSRDDGLQAAVYSGRFAKPIDEQLVGELAASGRPLLTVEDHGVAGGFGSAVMEQAAAGGCPLGNIRLLGLPDRYIAHANRSQQLAEAALDAASLAEAMRRAVRRSPAPHEAK